MLAFKPRTARAVGHATWVFTLRFRVLVFAVYTWSPHGFAFKVSVTMSPIRHGGGEWRDVWRAGEDLAHRRC